MQSFKPGDPVLILPKFAHLYGANSAVVIGVNPHPSRPMLNEYTVEFPDHSMSKVFEFQIIENPPSYTTTVARLVFDSRQQQPPMQTRGRISGFQVILQTPQLDLDMTIRTTKSRASIIGQVLDRSTKALLKNLDVRLMKDGTTMGTTKSDPQGIFQFTDVARGSVNILVAVPQTSSRILGAFSF
jgi:hypothetical protein